MVLAHCKKGEECVYIRAGRAESEPLCQGAVKCGAYTEHWDVVPRTNAAGYANGNHCSLVRTRTAGDYSYSYLLRFKHSLHVAVTLQQPVSSSEVGATEVRKEMNQTISAKRRNKMSQRSLARAANAVPATGTTSHRHDQPSRDLTHRLESWSRCLICSRRRPSIRFSKAASSACCCLRSCVCRNIWASETHPVNGPTNQCIIIARVARSDHIANSTDRVPLENTSPAMRFAHPGRPSARSLAGCITGPTTA